MHEHRSRLPVHNIVFKIAGARRAECRAVAEDELRFINRALTFKIFKLVQVITVRQRIGDAGLQNIRPGVKVKINAPAPSGKALDSAGDGRKKED